jgi:tyrosine-protein kinase Etk/Wzc
MPNQKDTNSEALVIKDFLSSALSYKYVYIACLLACLLFAFVINKITPTVFGVSSVIGPVEDKATLRGSQNLFNAAGDYNQVRNLENDINSLNSFSLVLSTIKNLNLEVGYFTEKKIIFTKSHQIYNGTPYRVNVDKSHIQPINARIYIKIIDDKSYRITSSSEKVSYYNYLDNVVVSEDNVFKIDTVCKFNQTAGNKNYKFSVSLNREDFHPGNSDEKMYFELYHLDLLANDYLRRIKVEAVSLKSSLIQVSFQGQNMDLTIDFLNKYLQAYLDEDLSKKNSIAQKQVSFIDTQISGMADSLVKSESKLKDYRSANQVTDLSYQGQQALQEMTKIESEKSSLQIQEHYYNYILDYFEKNQDGAGLAPPSSNVVDPIMNTLVTDYITLNKERSNILGSNTNKSLFLGPLDKKIALQRQMILENVRNSLNTLNLQQNELNYRYDKVSREISKLPRTELNMVSMQRRFNLSDAIYTFLLQKRSEAQITMASNIPDYEILEPARQTATTVLSPKKKLNYIAAFFLGIFLPTSFILLKKFFNEKITNVKDVEQLLGRTVLGTIYNSSYESETVVSDMPGSSVSESFRNLRSSLFLRYKSEQVKVILVTSSQPQDGKSFIAFNLASSIASVGYKTVIIDCDLRRSTLHEKFKVSNDFGLSTFMSDHTSKEEIIQESFIKNLSFIPAGPVLPNSSEMIEAGVLDDLIRYLKQKYQYIIIDTTPSGIVADAALMLKYSNINLVVCRNNYTNKNMFSSVLNLFKTNRVENFDIVFNDLKINEGRFGKYNQYYKKG